MLISLYMVAIRGLENMPNFFGYKISFPKGDWRQWQERDEKICHKLIDLLGKLNIVERVSYNGDIFVGFDLYVYLKDARNPGLNRTSAKSEIINNILSAYPTSVEISDPDDRQTLRLSPSASLEISPWGPDSKKPN